jgi:hypothetical protein
MVKPYYLVATAIGLAAVVAAWALLWYRMVRREREVIAGVTGAGAAEYYQGCVRGLLVTGPGFNGAQLRKLLALRSLQELQIDHTSVQDEDLRVLADFPHLQIIWFYDANLGDKAVKELASLPRLTVLGLRLPNMSEQGLAHLYGHRTLKQLRIECCRLSELAIDNLRRSLPECHIDIDNE